MGRLFFSKNLTNFRVRLFFKKTVNFCVRGGIFPKFSAAFGGRFLIDCLTFPPCIQLKNLIFFRALRAHFRGEDSTFFGIPSHFLMGRLLSPIFRGALIFLRFSDSENSSGALINSENLLKNAMGRLLRGGGYFYIPGRCRRRLEKTMGEALVQLVRSPRGAQGHYCTVLYIVAKLKEAPPPPPKFRKKMLMDLLLSLPSDGFFDRICLHHKT